MRKFITVLALGVLLANIGSGLSKVKATTINPYISISNASALEGDSGYGTMTFDVTLSDSSATPITLNYSTQNLIGAGALFSDTYGTAYGVASKTTAGGDYVTVTNGALTFSAGQVAKTIKIVTMGNTRVDPNRLFAVNLSNVVGATVIDGSGTGTIIDDDSQTGFRLGVGDISVREGASKSRTANLTVNFSQPAPAAFSLTMATQSQTAIGVKSATVKPTGDFLNKTATYSVAKGAKSKILPVNLLSDSVADGTKYFNVNISSTLGNVMRPTGKVEIRDAQATGTRPGRRPGPPRISFLGDSVTFNYDEVAKQMFETRGFQVYKHGFPGTGLLDSNWCQNQYANSTLTNDDPDIVVFESMANYGGFTKCNSAVTYGSPQFYSDWQAVAQSYNNILTSRGAQYYWILSPTVPGSGDTLPRHDAINTLNPVYQQIAASTPNTHTIDLWTPFGGDTPDCNLRDVGIAPNGYCLHLNVVGEQLFASIVNAGIQ